MTVEFEAKLKKRGDARKMKIESMPTIAMCEWEQYNPDIPELGRVVHRSQVIKMTKRSVVMRTIEKGGTVTLSSTPGWNVFDFVKIEMMPCDTSQWNKYVQEQHP